MRKGNADSWVHRRIQSLRSHVEAQLLGAIAYLPWWARSMVVLPCRRKGAAQTAERVTAALGFACIELGVGHITALGNNSRRAANTGSCCLLAAQLLSAAVQGAGMQFLQSVPAALWCKCVASTHVQGEVLHCVEASVLQPGQQCGALQLSQTQLQVGGAGRQAGERAGRRAGRQASRRAAQKERACRVEVKSRQREASGVLCHQCKLLAGEAQLQTFAGCMCVPAAGWLEVI